jgi:hypothetical protein
MEDLGYVINKLGCIWKEVTMPDLKTLSQYLSGWTEEKH